MENNVDLPQEIFVFENLFLTQMRVHLETENGFHKGIFFFITVVPAVVWVAVPLEVAAARRWLPAAAY